MGRPFFSITVQPCVVLEIFEATENALIELGSENRPGLKATTYAKLQNLSSTREKALAKIAARLAPLPTVDAEKSAVPEMAGASAAGKP